MKKHFNKASYLTILTVGLAGLQSYLLHIGTTDYTHKILSVYFFVELFIFLLTFSTGLKNRIFATIYFGAFLFEVAWFFINERPISPDNLIMIIIGFLRVYVFYLLTKQLSKNE
jgi:hypothetical protein